MITFLGFARDTKKIKRKKREDAAIMNLWNDAMHVAHARHAQIFLTADKRLSRIATAVFSHVGARCGVLLQDRKTGKVEPVHLPSRHP